MSDLQARTYWPADYGFGHIDGHPVVLVRGGGNFYDHDVTTRDDLAWHVHCTVDTGHIADARHLARLLNAGQQ